MIVSSMGDHFRKRWSKRVRGLPVPCLGVLNTLIAEEGKRIRDQKNDLYRMRNGCLEPYKLLAEYWIDRYGLIIKVDEDTERAVTVVNVRSLRRR